MKRELISTVLVVCAACKGEPATRSTPKVSEASPTAPVAAPAKATEVAVAPTGERCATITDALARLPMPASVKEAGGAWPPPSAGDDNVEGACVYRQRDPGPISADLDVEVNADGVVDVAVDCGTRRDLYLMLPDGCVRELGISFRGRFARVDGPKPEGMPTLLVETDASDNERFDVARYQFDASTKRYKVVASPFDQWPALPRAALELGDEMASLPNPEQAKSLADRVALAIMTGEPELLTSSLFASKVDVYGEKVARAELMKRLAKEGMQKLSRFAPMDTGKVGACGQARCWYFHVDALSKQRGKARFTLSSDLSVSVTFADGEDGYEIVAIDGDEAQD